MVAPLPAIGKEKWKCGIDGKDSIISPIATSQCNVAKGKKNLFPDIIQYFTIWYDKRIFMKITEPNKGFSRNFLSAIPQNPY